MSVEGLEHYSKDQLIEELINRQTFAGIVIFCRGDAKAGRLESGDVVVTKSPPLTREGVENLLQTGQSQISALFEGTMPVNDTRSVNPLLLQSETPPCRVDEGGAVRVGNSRVTLDLIVEQYENGGTPEDLVRAYDTLALADVYAAIAYYLRHRLEVGAYLKIRTEQAQALQAQIENDYPRVNRDELLERRIAREQDHAATGQ